MNQSADTRSGPLEHDINASREPRTELFDLVSTPAAADWKPWAHLELVIQWRQRSFFGRPMSCWRTRTAGRGVYAIDQRNGNARYLVAALQMERTNLPARS